MVLLGLAAVIGASIFYGSVFVPIKGRPAGDGFFSQLMMSLGGLFVGIAVHLYEGCPPIYPLPMIGGVIWCLANSISIKLMSMLGMALAILVWNTSSCITGWAIARFGLFGVEPQLPASNLLNVVGVALLVLGGSLYLFIRSEPEPISPEQAKALEASASAKEAGLEAAPNSSNVAQQQTLSVSSRILAVIGALCSGLGFGSMTAPVTYMQQHTEDFEGASTRGMPYVLSFFCGVISCSVLLFLLYIIRMRNRPYIEPSVAAPALCCGVLLAVCAQASVQNAYCGNTMCFFAIEQLSQTIAFPLVAMLPGLVTSMWSVFYFKEIVGVRNLLFLAIAYCITLSGLFLVTISKDIVL